MAFWDFLTRDVIVAINALERKLMAALDDLKREVRETREQSVTVIGILQSQHDTIKDIRAKLDEMIQNGTDPAALQAMSEELESVQADMRAKLDSLEPTSETDPVIEAAMAKVDKAK